MARTYRKTNKGYNSWWMPEEWQKITHDVKYRQHRDGAGWEDTKWHFKQVHRVGRNCAREQFYLLSRCLDYQAFSFDPSKHEKKRRGVWWDIY